MKTLGGLWLMLWVVLAGCGGNETVEGYDASPDTDFDPGLSISFPEKQASGTLPLQAGGRFKVRLEAHIPHLCEPIAASVELVTAGTPEGATVSAQAKLTPQEPCDNVAGEVELAWPDGGEVLVRATLAGSTKVERATFGPRDTLELGVDVDASVLPSAGEVVEVVVLARLNGVATPGIPMRLEVVPATQVLPAVGVSDGSGAFHASILVPKDTQEMRIDAISGGVRRGITVRRAP
ncbi:hypothetical protein [Myxococcus sp. RHSTA-1-4]|uniref:hypothetical protein n=1 Tax=Myxococcus sp. RHSTA-1-4 TaxID=2874601 RepID=UPI001CBB00E2|nr:hypothetical protein [Myxococcus sp. RHSTA-1-4]MBZ4416195.1 hypothetical protein [Myxococcus sp. RHSTA-1-4]